MWTKNKTILLLAAAGILLFGTVQGVILPKWERDRQAYEAAQQNPQTHDLQSIAKYENKYMGNASNLSNLMHSLPLNEVRSTFELHPDTLTADIVYHAKTAEINQERLDRSLIYNATAAFALIGNLSEIRFKFDDRTYTAKRSDLEHWYGKKLSSLTDSPKIWQPVVQQPLDHPDYVKKGIASLFTIL
ncbi:MULTISPECIES: DUF4825 domain-containing protein [Paenibacillus]|uniref:DUF4825 domain-containing protein n=1 Tax=Paenibacillus albilobatus TaxID=2716884 RepID=A0A919XLT1_9BACL|nr:MULTISPECIES: DUF4825 domain-containing protein [Paenibacillus]GIO32538.1 hypothetical protein J2TS6_36790 [Paenibacillus albilobatus]